MFCWYINERLGIFFDCIPFVGVRYCLPSMTKEEKRSVDKYPFISKRRLKLRLEDYEKNKQYEFIIPKGYCFDGASIPRFFWRIIGANTDNKFLIPALVHDILCENHDYINSDRSFSTNIFNALLECSEVSCIKRFFMKNSVACYQTIFCKW